MTIDVYQLCPCGSGKKIKFCCCRDITNDLGKIIQKLDGDQRVAALDQVNKAVTKHGNREALLAIKAIAELQLGNEEGAAKTVDVFLAVHPDNSVALALSATVKSTQDDPRGGIEPLQRALEKVGEYVPDAVYESIGALAEALLVAGHVLPARAHLLLQAALAGEEDEDIAEILTRLGRSPHLPLLLKQTPQLDECLEGSPLEAEFNAALDLASRGTWLAAAERFVELLNKAPDEPSIHRNLGILYCCLGQNDDAIAALRRYASSDGEVDLDDAVEAEALAQLLDPEYSADRIPVVAVKYPLRDMDKLLEKFTDEKRIDRVPVDTTQMGGEDKPPPKGVYSLLDRPLPETGADLQREQIPNILGQLLVFGRETDREARLEAVFSETDDFDDKKKALTDLVGDLLEESTETEQISDTPAIEGTLAWNWRMPDDTPIDRREQLAVEQRRDTVLNRWPTMKVPGLGGKVPDELKDNPAYRIRLLAAVWLLEMSGEMSLWDVDYNELRERLGLPLAEPIDPAENDVLSLPLTRLARLALDRLTEEQLVIVFQRAMAHQAHNAIRATAQELLARESMQAQVHTPNLYGTLARTARNSHIALDMVHKAQQAARDRNESPAPWLVMELSLRVRRGEAEEFMRLMNELQARHMREPGIAQAVTQIMVQHGMISQEDVNAATRAQVARSMSARGADRLGVPGAGPVPAPGVGMGAMPMVDPAAMPDPAMPAGEPPDGGDRLWTPDAPAPSDEPASEKPKIWMPGMD
jgi:tetratricopeptide (TPR) repeat protein